MSDGSLSQDEIDALLQGTGGMDFDSGPVTAALNEQQRGAFENLVNGTVSSQQSNLSMLVNNEVQLSAGTLELMDREQFSQEIAGSVVGINIDLTEGTPGRHLYVLGEDAAVQIAGPMMGQDDVDLDDAAVNALQEAFSQISGPVITALGDKAGTTVMNEPPAGVHGGPDQLPLPDGQFVKFTYTAIIGDAQPVQIYEIFDADIALAALGTRAAAAAPRPAASSAGSGGGAIGGDAMAGLMAGATQDQGGGFGGMTGGFGMGGNPSVQSVQFPNLSPAGAGSEQGNIGLLMDVYMEMTVELGRTRKLIKEILGMGEGTIIELDKLAGEPVDILVNHKLIAKGEVVVIDENFGVRVTEIVSPMERMGNSIP